jgi:hypothetical protein
VVIENTLRYQDLLRGQHDLYYLSQSATMALMVPRQSGEEIPPNSISRPRLIEIASVLGAYPVGLSLKISNAELRSKLL